IPEPLLERELVVVERRAHVPEEEERAIPRAALGLVLHDAKSTRHRGVGVGVVAGRNYDEVRRPTGPLGRDVLAEDDRLGAVATVLAETRVAPRVRRVPVVI